MRQENSKYQLLYFIRYLGDSFFYPFLTLFLATGIKGFGLGDYSFFNTNTTGYSNAQIGQLMMILPLVAIFINPLWAIFSRNINQTRRFTLIFSTIEGILIILLTFFTQDFKITLILFLMLAVVGQPIYHLIDSFTKVYIDLKRIEYLSIRIFASMAYVIGSLVAGLLLYFYQDNFNIIFACTAVCFIISSIIMYFITPIEKDKAIQARTKSNPRKLFTNPNYFLFVIMFVLVTGSLFSFDTYLPNYMQQVFNFKPSYMGFLVAMHVLIEVLIMLVLAKWGRKVPISLLILTMIFSQVIRFTSYAFSSSIYLIIGLTTLRSVTMSFYIYVYLRLIMKVVAPENLTLGLVLGGSITSVYNALMVYLGGRITNTLSGYRLWYILGASLSLVSLLYYLNIYKVIHKKETVETKIYRSYVIKDNPFDLNNSLDK